jgi:outer membrane autotransporter protein
MHNRRLIGRAFLGATALAAICVASPAAAQHIDNIVAFGDSYADDGNAITMLLASPFVPPATKAQLQTVYGTGRFSGGTNYIDTLSQLLGAPVDNFAIGGALTNDFNTNGPVLPGFTTEWNAFLSGNTLGGVLPSSDGTFDEHDLLAISVGGNDARFYQTGNAGFGIPPGTLAGAPAAATASAASATTGLNALVAAGARNISFLAGNTAILPEVAADPAAQAIRNAYSTTFNTAIQSTLANYAADGVMVHYLDLTTIGQRIIADPAAFGFSSTAPCTPSTQCVTSTAFADQFLFYVDGLHLTSAGFAIVGKYVATQLQAPLTLEAPSELGLDTARQFGRTLSSRVDLVSPRDGEVAEGAHLFFVGDTFSRDLKANEGRDHFDVDGTGGTLGVSYGFGNGIVGIAANYTRPKAKFIGDPFRDEAKTWQLGGFAGYAIAGAFAQGYLGYGHESHDLTRMGVIDSLSADPDGSHWLAGAKAGYLLPLGILRAGPVVAIDYAKAKVDSYTEEGDAALSLNVDSVSAKSLTGSIGAELRGDFDDSGVALRPFVSAVVEKEFSDGHRTLHFAQTSAPGIVNSWVVGDGSDGLYGRISGGASAAILKGVSLNALASTTIGRDGGNDLSAHVGVDVGF